MATAIKRCRVCGKEYQACCTNKTIEGVSRWRDVAFSYEFGATYLEQVLAARCKALLPVEDSIDNVLHDALEDAFEKDFDDEDDFE